MPQPQTPTPQKINPRKLLNSKWTKVNPQNKEKHFMVVRLDYDDDNQLVDCVIEAVLSKRRAHINWRDLQNRDEWLSGWLR